MSKLPVRTSDRVISALTYLTAGWAGMIVLVVMYFAKKCATNFLRFNVFQSIFLSLLLLVLSMILDFIIRFLTIIPYINRFVSQIVFTFNRPFLFDYSLIQVMLVCFVLYMVVMSLFGLYPRIYKISNIVDYAARGY